MTNDSGQQDDDRFPDEDVALIEGTRKFFAIDREVRVVLAPADYPADKLFRDYGGKYLYQVDGDFGGKSVCTVIPQPPCSNDTRASSQLEQSRGGAYFPEHDLILISEEPTGGFTRKQVLVHEIGHIRQVCQGYLLDPKHGSQSMWEYHNIAANENPVRFKDGEQARLVYDDPDWTLPTSAAAHYKVTASPKPEVIWGILKEHVTGTQDLKMLEEFEKAVADKAYDAQQQVARGSLPVTGRTPKYIRRDFIKARLACRFLNDLYQAKA
ncbi:hypothetical protein ACGF0D_12670 [Kitasatospora sp. NPDC048298]|uniref:hypothetical protein n=1 Tax=Kitasatospora sp. NPDC048298 TaxID=3364049 RepID=UPI0037133B25